MKKSSLLTMTGLLLTLTTMSAQRSSGPPTAPSGKPPDTVFLEDLTWAETRDLVKGGTTTVIIGTAGTEQKGPHMVDGEHKFVMEYTADKIARSLGKTLVAPVVTYVPEGSWENPGGHMAKPGTITLPEDRFVELLVHAGRSLKSGGFTTILFLGESGGNRTGMRTAAIRLNDLWKGAAKAYWVDDYYTKSHSDQNAYVTKTLGVPADKIGGHANVLDTSELMFVNAKHVRPARFAPGGGYENSGVSGDPSKSTPALGKVFLQIKIDNALAQIKAMTSGAMPPVADLPTGSGGAGGGRGGRGGGGAPEGGGAGAPATAAPRRPTMETAPAGLSPSQAPDTVFIDELTWEETRDAMKAGKTTVIVPTGGTEKNGYHMVLGKHI
jgi:creatinine amidohydrolase